MKKLLITVKHHVLTPIRAFLADSRSVGILLICCVCLSLALSNWGISSHAYISFWLAKTPVFLLHLPESRLVWINDVFMTFFFLLVGLEIKRELTVGELKSVKKFLLPVIAALGRMQVPALFLRVFNGGTPFAKGWGIPMATDIAFSLGVLSLLGKKVPIQLKIFLAALAIIDDLGAVVTIAVFYTAKLNGLYLLGGTIVLTGIWLLNYLKVKSTAAYLLPGLLLWLCLFNSGVHPTIAGVLMAFSMPLKAGKNGTPAI